MAAVHILTHDIDDVQQIISVSLSLERAILAFDGYCDALEAEWRKNEAPGPANAFNRFDEVVDNCIRSAAVSRPDEDGRLRVRHGVYLTIYQSI